MPVIVIDRLMYNHFQYAEQLARSLKSIGHRDDDRHFLKFDETAELEDLALLTSSISGMLLVAIDGLNSDFGLNGADGLTDTPQYFIVILKDCPQGDLDLYHSTKQSCKTVAEECLKRMLIDRYNEVNGLEHLDTESITCRGVGPIGDNFYGVLLGFTLTNPRNYQLNPDMWL